MREFSIIGKRLSRVDGPVKANGEAKYTVDVNLPGMLYGKILRSPYPHARISNIDITKAERLSGVKGVITGRETLGVKYCIIDLPQTCDEPQLAVEKVRYIGEGVAVVAAIDEDIAEEALDLIEVDYEELPPLFTPEEAMALDAPKIHEHCEGNISWKIFINSGDVEKVRL